MARSPNRPQRKRLPYLKAGISVVEKIKLTVYMCRGIARIDRRAQAGPEEGSLLSPNLKLRNDPKYFRVRSEEVHGIDCSALQQ